MTTVSILIPAFKSTYLKQCLDSAVAQTFDDIEIIVGDDTPHGSLERIVSQYDTPKIRYLHHGFQDGPQNCRKLWERSTGQYIKWLYDDDVLMPNSVASLMAALRTHPQATFAFHERVIIDQNGKVIHQPPRLLADGHIGLIDRTFMVRNMVANGNNFIGEPSNILLNKDLADVSRRQMYKTWQLQFLTDVGSYLNMCEDGPAVAVGGYLGAFRRHSNQASNASSPIFSAGLFEWELMLRGEVAAGNLDPAVLPQAGQRLEQTYRSFVATLPELQGFIDNLHELSDSPPERLLDSQPFLSALAQGQRAVAARKAARKSAADPQARMCPLCEQRVAAWIPHPHHGSRGEFVAAMDVIGSNTARFHCPNCHSNDHERHVWQYINRTKLLNNLRGKRILHIAPEALLEPRIRELAPLEYICGDLYPRSPLHQKVDIEQLQFPDGYFDLIICNHVLEHVGQPLTALAEFKRCLTPIGFLIAQTPYSPRLKHTFEMVEAVSKPFATLFFGQDDHVRLFGIDIVDYFHAAGLNGRLIPHAEILSDVDPLQAGINECEPFFLFSKGPLPV